MSRFICTCSYLSQAEGLALGWGCTGALGQKLLVGPSRLEGTAEAGTLGTALCFAPFTSLPNTLLHREEQFFLNVLCLPFLHHLVLEVTP